MKIEHLSVAARDRVTGAVSMQPYYISGKWANSGDWLWEYAIEKAKKLATENNSHVMIHYNDQIDAVGGFRSNEA